MKGRGKSASNPKAKTSAISKKSDADQGKSKHETEGVVDGGPKEGSTEKKEGKKRKAVAKNGESGPVSKKSKSKK